MKLCPKLFLQKVLSPNGITYQDESTNRQTIPPTSCRPPGLASAHNQAGQTPGKTRPSVNPPPISQLLTLIFIFNEYYGQKISGKKPFFTEYYELFLGIATVYILARLDCFWHYISTIPINLCCSIYQLMKFEQKAINQSQLFFKSIFISVTAFFT